MSADQSVHVGFDEDFAGARTRAIGTEFIGSAMGK